ncbi:MAG TPA: AAA family ATPase [Anaerolineae bacterium]|nr:AAA family ATPase [Anaerolineae bacterium]HPL28001.1 AAA family ATPase [Anaerolineae bacterium]
MPKLAITGKGGVGKTTLAALLAHLYAAEGQTVLAIDADPDANLGSALGFTPEALARMHPIADMKDLIAERTGTQPGQYGGIFTLNPRVDDIPDRFAAVRGGVRLLVLGTVQRGGAGCFCPENTLLKNLMLHLMVGRREVVILDMEAGLEHLGRATAAAVDAFVVVVEPGRRSLQTAQAVAQLARDIGVGRIMVVGNKVRGPEDEAFIARSLPGVEVLGYLPFSQQAIEADLAGQAIYEAAPELVARAQEIKERLGGT